MGADIDFEVIVPARKTKFCHQCMIELFDILQLKYQKHETNGIVIDENHNIEFLFTMKIFVSFGTYHPSIFYAKQILKVEYL